MLSYGIVVSCAKSVATPHGDLKSMCMQRSRDLDLQICIRILYVPSVYSTYHVHDTCVISTDHDQTRVGCI